MDPQYAGKLVAPMRITFFRQTPFITHDGKNMLQVRVADWDYCNPFRVRIAAQGRTLCEGPLFMDHFTLLIPSPEQEMDCTVTLTPFEDAPVVRVFHLHPPKKWRIGLVYSSHEDIGYCAWANKLEYESYQYLMEAVKLCEAHPDFRYMIEHVWWLQAFERYATKEEQARLQALLSGERIGLNAICCGYHTHWAEAEQLIEGAQFATLEAAKRWGIRPDTAIFTDLSGMSWQAVPAYAGQGIRYAGILENGGFRKPDHEGNPPPLFRWRGQNGRDSLLCWYQTGYRGALGGIWCDTNRQYPEGSFFFDESKALKTEAVLSDVLSPLQDAPYDILPYSFYDDRERPTTMLLTVCDFMNRRWAWPRFSMELPGVMLRQIEAQSGDRLPVLAGDLADQWGDFCASAPEWLSTKRRAMRRLLPAQALASLRALEGEPYDREAFREIVRLGCLFDEHCWATSSKHPQKMHRFNLAYTKKRSAEQALALAQGQLSAALGLPGDTVGLYNPLPENRCHPLRLPRDCVPEGVEAQFVGDEAITAPMAFDPMEGKRFPRRSEPLAPARPAPACFETDRYRVVTDPAVQKITGILNKATGRELLDPDAPFALGEYVYAVTEDKNHGPLSFEVTKARGFTVEEGPVAFVVTRRGYEEQSGASVLARFVFYKHAPDIDVTLEFSGATGLMGDYYDRYKKNIFFALPFHVEGHAFYTQLAGGRAHRADEKMHVCPMDFTLCEEWLAVEGASGGIGLRSEDSPVFHLSQINYNRFLAAPDFPCSHMYLYAASNRTNNLNFCTAEDCRGAFRLTIRPYEGHCEDVLPAWSRALSQPVLCGDGRSVPQLSVTAGLRLLCLKPEGEDSLLLRFAEETGRAQQARLTLPFAPRRACCTDLNGEPLEALTVDGRTVSFPVRGGEYATLRVWGDFRIREKARVQQPVHDVFTVNVERDGCIVCFAKSKELPPAAGFRILSGHGQVLAEVENAPEAVQTVELACRPERVQVEIIPGEEKA